MLRGLMEIHHHEHEPHKTGHNMFDLAVSLCALLISAVSIYMAWHTGHMMEKLVHANSWPFLQLGSSNGGGDGTLAIGFAVSNAGTGPARIHSFELLVDGKLVVANGKPVRKDVQFSLDALLHGCCSDRLQRDLKVVGGNRDALLEPVSTSPVHSRFLAPSAGASALHWPRTESNKALWEAMDEARKNGRIVMRACYCSVFDECWLAETGKFPPESVDSCAASR